MKPIYYVDCDGVMIDSDTRLSIMKKKAGFIEHTKESYYKYFEYAEKHLEEWDYIIKEANQINKSIDIIKEYEKLKKIIILTKIHSLYEMNLKYDILRNKWNIKSDIIFVPPYSSKSEIVDPKGNKLVDDLEENIIKWNEDGGEGILFDSKIKENSKNKIKNLKLFFEN